MRHMILITTWKYVYNGGASVHTLLAKFLTQEAAVAAADAIHKQGQEHKQDFGQTALYLGVGE